MPRPLGVLGKRPGRQVRKWRERFMDRRGPPPGGWYNYLRDGWFDGVQEWRERYELYLKSSSWKQRRTAALKRAKHCSLCPSTERLQLHHVDYQRAGQERLEDIRVLCRACHAMRHAQKGQGPIPYDSATRRKLENRALTAAGYIPRHGHI